MYMIIYVCDPLNVPTCSFFVIFVMECVQEL